jgi:hypothetical protein
VRVEEHRGPAVIEEIGVRASSSRKRKAPAAGDEPATLLFDFMHPFGAALAALGRLRKGWWDETGRQWTWEVDVVLSRALHERAPALVIVMDAHANPLRVRGVHRGEYERDREYHQNYEPHDQYSRWETTGAQRRGHWRILVAHVPVIGAEMRSTLRGGAIRVQVPSPHSGSGGTTTRRCATTSEEPICFVVVFTYSIPARDIECIPPSCRCSRSTRRVAIRVETKLQTEPGRIVQIL